MSILLSTPLALASPTLDDAQNAAVDVWTQLERSFEPVWDMLPKVTAVIIVLVVGYIVARIVARGVHVLAGRVGLDAAADRSGLAESMKKVGIQRTLSAIVAQLFFWLLMCVFLMTSFSLVDLPELTAATQKLVDYIPNLLAATAVPAVPPLPPLRVWCGAPPRAARPHDGLGTAEFSGLVGSRSPRVGNRPRD